MDILEIMKERHSVRQYRAQTIEEEKRAILNALADDCNRKSGLHIQIFFDEPKCFQGILAHFGKFSEVENYIALVGKKDADLETSAGYYGEKIVLKAQEIGLNTCWVALTHGKCAAEIKKGEKLVCVIALGYGETPGTPHKSKPVEQLYRSVTPLPEWFLKGMEAAMLAPTAMNQQKFCFTLTQDRVAVEAGKGSCTKLDLGIAVYHFEAATGYRTEQNPERKMQEEITRKGNPAKPQGVQGEQMLLRMNESHAPVTEWALSFLDFKEEDQVLEIGCGGGATLLRMSKRIPAGHLTGVDYSEVSVRLSRETNAEDIRNRKTEVLEASVEKLPFEDEKFDKIVTVESFYFWPNPAENLKEVLRTLKTGGVFLLIADIYRKEDLGKEAVENVRRYQMFNPSEEEFAKLFAQAGFSETKIHKKDGRDWICVMGVR